MKKKATAFVICIFFLVALFIVYIFSELYTESDMFSNIEKSITDSIKFKQEYENLNGKETDNNKIIRTISINEKNSIKYTTDVELLDKMNNNESFIVYFGFSSCPWCRSVMEEFLSTASENSIESIYYLDIEDIRDKYELNEKHEAVRTKEGTNAYYELLNKLSSVLDDYEPLTYVNNKGKTKRIVINEKRIYAPNFVVVKNGEPVIKVTGIKDTMEDPYMELNDDLKAFQRSEFNKLFSQLKNNYIPTTCESSKC